MATTATLLAVPVTGAKNNHLSTSIESTKRKNQESLMSTRKNKPAQSEQQSSPTQSTMITECEKNNEDGEIRVNGSIANRTTSRLSIEKSQKMFSKAENSPTSMERSNTVEIPISNDSTNVDSQLQQGKRKLSVSQYKEHKRLKSNEIAENASGDVDMRIPYKPPSSVQISHKPTVGHVSTQQSTKLTTRTLEKGVTKKSNLSEPGLKKILKKKVIWADEKQQELVQTSFFEIDDLERMSKRSFIQQFANPMSIAQFEKLEERNFFQQHNRQDFDDRPASLPPLPALIRIHLPSAIPNPVVKSHQRIVQEDRERTVLQALLIGSFVPDSPAEPDSESTEDCSIETKLIPLEDDSSTSTISDPQPMNVTPSSNQIDSKGNNLASLSSLINAITSANPTNDTISPQVAQILAKARGNLTANTSITPPVNPIVPQVNPMMSIAPSTQNLFSALFAGTQPVNVSSMNSLANMLTSLPIQYNPLAASLLPLMNQPLSNGLPTVNAPAPAPVTQPQQFSPPQTLNPSQNFSNTSNESHAPRRDYAAPNQYNSSKFSNKHFNHRGNPNHRKPFHRRGPANGHRRNFSDRNAFD